MAFFGLAHRPEASVPHAKAVPPVVEAGPRRQVAEEMHGPSARSSRLVKKFHHLGKKPLRLVEHDEVRTLWNAFEGSIR